LESTINEALEWLDDHPEADKEEYDAKQKEVEKIVNPIMKELYQAAGAGSAGGAGGGDDSYDFDDEL